MLVQATTLYDECLTMLREAEIDVKFASGVSESVLLKEAKDVDGIILGLARINRKIIENADRLKVIGRLGVGVENIDLDAATENGVIVTYAGEANAQSVAEHAICFVTILARQAIVAHRIVQHGGWLREYLGSVKAVELLSKTLGVIGFGRIGERVAKMAKALGMRVLVSEIDPKRYNAILAIDAELVDMKTLLKESDFITLHAPLVKKTYHLIGERELKLMKKTAFLINASRGEVIDEGALIKALQDKNIAGAGLDTFEKEPPSPDNPLLTMENVVLSPHIGWCTEESRRRTIVTVVQDVVKALKGEMPVNIVNKEVLARADTTNPRSRNVKNNLRRKG